jgi:hypothetical protein
LVGGVFGTKNVELEHKIYREQNKEVLDSLLNNQFEPFWMQSSS